MAIGFSSSFQRAKAVLVVSFRMDSFAKACGLTEINAQDYLCGYLTDEAGRIVYHPQEQWLGRPAKEYRISGSAVELEMPLSYFGWSGRIAIDTGNLRSDVNRLYNRAIAVYILLLAACCRGFAFWGIFSGGVSACASWH